MPKKIETPPEIATGFVGPAYIVLKTPEGETLRILQQVKRWIVPSEALEKLSGAELAQLQRQIARVQPRAERAFASLILDWNWTDFETGEALPRPPTTEVIFSELSQDQIAWIRQQLIDLLFEQYRPEKPGGKQPWQN